MHMRNRLAEKLAQRGGISAKQAIQVATANVETLREPYLAAIPGEISALGAILASQSSTRVTRAQLKALQERAGFILTLSGTFGCDLLDVVTKKFCDLCSGMMEQSLDDSAPLKIHIEAMRLVSPGAVLVNDEAAATLLLEHLGKIHDHLNIRAIGATYAAACPDIPPAALIAAGW